MPVPRSNTQSGNAQLDGGQFLTELAHTNSRQAAFFQKIITFVNQLATAGANSGSGEIAPPPPIAGMTVKTAGEMIHVAHDHPGSIQRGIQYFTEIGVNDPGFKQPMVIDHGASRTSHPFTLPTKDDGGNTINYYFRSYAQYHGSRRSGYAYLGTEKSPTAVTLTGSTQLTPITSFGSGTAANTGTQGGQGLGNFLFREQAGPKRTT